MFDPLSDETIGYHLFFEPNGKLGSELSTIIKSVAHEYGGPLFSPHVTLLARIPDDDESILIEKAGRLAAALQPLTLTLGGLASEQMYFRALYSQIVEQSETKKYHARAAEAYAMDINPSYVAHLSLLYGNVPEDRKAITKKNIELPVNGSFLADKIHLYKTHGRAENWYKVQEFTLGE
jgi:2'-5' RNA ligase